MLNMTDLHIFTFTIDHKSNEESHLFSYSSYLPFLGETMDSKPSLEITVFFL